MNFGGKNMAKRQAFIVDINSVGRYVLDTMVDFTWFPGFSIKQKQRSIEALHNEIINFFPDKKVLEISSKSPDPLGVQLSAFNLMIEHKNSKESFSVECAFQSSKVFERGGPFVDIRKKSSKDAKKDERLKTSGKLKKFQFYNTTWELEPKTLFYDWLYINALAQYENLCREIIKFDIFTDIEFNHEKSINCQARSAALFVSLYRLGLLDKALKSKEDYIDIVTNRCIKKKNEQFSQISLLDMKIDKNLPKYDYKNNIGDDGVRITQNIIAKNLKWVFREQTKNDFGIDAYIEIIDENKSATGRLIAAQIKCGESYFREQTEEEIIFRGKLEHINYWINYALPVILIVCNPRDEICYWVEVTHSNATILKDGWKISIPKKQILSVESKEILREIAGAPMHKDIIEVLLFKFLYEKYKNDIRICHLIDEPRDFHGLSYLANIKNEFVFIGLHYVTFNLFNYEVIKELLDLRDSNDLHMGNKGNDTKLYLFFVADSSNQLKIPDEIRTLIAQYPNIEIFRLIYENNFYESHRFIQLSEVDENNNIIYS